MRGVRVVRVVRGVCSCLLAIVWRGGGGSWVRGCVAHCRRRGRPRAASDGASAGAAAKSAGPCCQRLRTAVPACGHGVCAFPPLCSPPLSVSCVAVTGSRLPSQPPTGSAVSAVPLRGFCVHLRGLCPCGVKMLAHAAGDGCLPSLLSSASLTPASPLFGILLRDAREALDPGAAAPRAVALAGEQAPSCAGGRRTWDGVGRGLCCPPWRVHGCRLWVCRTGGQVASPGRSLVCCVCAPYPGRALTAVCLCLPRFVFAF